MVYEYNATVLDVYDGDTITLLIDVGFNIHLKQKCRLYGIDTPELRTKNKKEKELAIKARDYLKELILNKKVKIKTYKDDKYGRMLADIYLDDIYVNMNLIEKGYAVSYLGAKKTSWF